MLHDGPGGRYLVQHSAGSGKTNSIAWTAHFLAELHDAQDKKLFDSVLVVSDRTVIDTQSVAPMPPGRVENVVFEFPLSALGEAELVVRVDDIGTGAGLYPECDEVNNEVVWGRIECGSR